VFFFKGGQGGCISVSGTDKGRTLRKKKKKVRKEGGGCVRACD